VDLSSCLPAARNNGTTVLVRQRSQLQRVPLLPVLAAETVILRITSLQPMRWLTAQPAQRTDYRGGRNARATSKRSRAFPISPGNSPSRIASCHQRHRNHHSANFELCHVFAEPTLGQNVAARNRKTFPPCAETVDDRTSLWKPEENSAEKLVRTKSLEIRHFQ
jgi:hypothetical protein